MKRMSLIVGLTALGVGCLAYRLYAQGSAASGAGRVAIVNIGLVFSKYEKALFFKSEMELVLKPYRVQGEKLKKEIIDWTQYMQHPKFDVKEKERYEQGILANKRALEDLDREARAKVGKKQEEQIIALFRDVSQKVEGYARNNGIQLVLAYGQQIEGDIYGFANITRIMQGMDLGSTTPMFFVPGVDISNDIVTVLNQSYRAAGGTVVPGTPTSLPKK